MHGVLVVDKPRGPTSHDVVAKVRRALGTRRVGHAGTLDPEATGVLVVAVGEATKLVAWLVAADKHYEAVIALGSETDTLDAAGRVVETAPVSHLSDGEVDAALAAFLGVTRQRAPRVSAIKVGGRRLHARTRRGEDVEAPEREVVLHAASARVIDRDHIALDLHCGKGFYVRSLARDLALALGTRGHLASLRRTRSGAFGLTGAVGADLLARAASGEQVARDELVERLLPLSDVWPGAHAFTDERGRDDAEHGRRITAEHVPSGFPTAEGDVVLLHAPDGEAIAIAERSGDVLRVVRGISAAFPSA
jgi:tRNA pseudouridine55 synthase